METVPPELRQRLHRHRQLHVLTGWKQLERAERRRLVSELERLDLTELQRLHSRRHHQDALPDWERLAPLPRPAESDSQLEEYRRLGQHALQAGEVAYLVVAGGQGTRLGFDHPKGMFPVGPVSGKTLFQLHAEKILALSRRHGKPLPLIVTTSPETHAATTAFFDKHRCFGLPREHVDFFCQGTMPALDFNSGRLLLEAPGRLALSPNGHGGVLEALRKSGLFPWLKLRRIRTIFYFQVDNPLTNLADLHFLGRHLAQQAEVSSKVLPKNHPKEKMGNFVLLDGRCSIIEYSDLPDEWATMPLQGSGIRDQGSGIRDQEPAKASSAPGLFFWGGNTAIHLFDVEFLARVSARSADLPWHLAKKKAAFLGPDGQLVDPDSQNALKFERFIFDVLPLAERWTIASTTRETDFEPLKNATGDDSPATVRRALIHQAATWLEQAGGAVPRDEQGQPRMPIEISPLFALDAAALRTKPGLPRSVERDLYLGGEA